jgi:ATP-dependent protease ClpP protease subunit
VGGMLDHAYYAFNMIEALSVRLITWNTGNIQSAANILFLVGDERYATPGATFFFHQTGYETPAGRLTTAFLAQRLGAAQYDDSRSAGIIATKIGKPPVDVQNWLAAELIMDPTAAITHGLVQGVRQLVIPPDAFFHQITI